jgi:hypothetical protein
LQAVEVCKVAKVGAAAEVCDAAKIGDAAGNCCRL